MSRIPDTEILYFDPSATIIAPLRDKHAKPLMTKYKEPPVHPQENITVYSLPPVLPFFYKKRFINRINQKKIAKFIREKMKEHGFENPVLWVYSPVTVDLVDLGAAQRTRLRLRRPALGLRRADGPGAGGRDGAGAGWKDGHDVRDRRGAGGAAADGAAEDALHPERREL